MKYPRSWPKQAWYSRRARREHFVELPPTWRLLCPPFYVTLFSFSCSTFRIVIPTISANEKVIQVDTDNVERCCVVIRIALQDLEHSKQPIDKSMFKTRQAGKKAMPACQVSKTRISTFLSQTSGTLLPSRSIKQVMSSASRTRGSAAVFLIVLHKLTISIGVTIVELLSALPHYK